MAFPLKLAKVPQSAALLGAQAGEDVLVPRVCAQEPIAVSSDAQVGVGLGAAPKQM